MQEPINMNRWMEQQLSGAALFSKPFLDGIERASRMQDEGLKHLEGMITEALARQRAGCTALQQLAEQMRAAREASAILSAQQEWFSGAMQRFMSDATFWQAAGAALLRGMSEQAEPVKQVGQSPPLKRADQAKLNALLSRGTEAAD